MGQVFSQFTSSADAEARPPCLRAWTSTSLPAGAPCTLSGGPGASPRRSQLGGGLSTAVCDGDPTKAIIRQPPIRRDRDCHRRGQPMDRRMPSAAPGWHLAASAWAQPRRRNVVASYSTLSTFTPLRYGVIRSPRRSPGVDRAPPVGPPWRRPTCGTWAVLKQAPSASVIRFSPPSDNRSAGDGHSQRGPRPRSRGIPRRSGACPPCSDGELVAPNQGARGAAVPVTINGSGFVIGSTVNLGGTGVTVSNGRWRPRPDDGDATIASGASPGAAM